MICFAYFINTECHSTPTAIWKAGGLILDATQQFTTDTTVTYFGNEKGFLKNLNPIISKTHFGGWVGSFSRHLKFIFKYSDKEHYMTIIANYIINV